MLRDLRDAVEGSDPDGLKDDDCGPPESVKCLVGVNLDVFDVSDAARDQIEEAIQPDNSAPAVASENGQEAADWLVDTETEDAVGFDPDTLQEPARDTGKEK